MKKIIQMDLYRHAKQIGWIALFEQFFTNPGFRFVFILRLCSSSKPVTPWGLLLRIYYKHLRVKYGYQIPFKTQIGGGLVLGHFGNLIINQRVIIGENCNIAQGVTIGQVNRGKRKGCPTIGNRVWIGANAVVVGNIRIGNDALIAPLSYVTEDIPDNAVVTGNPSKIVNYNGSLGYINNVL